MAQLEESQTDLLCQAMNILYQEANFPGSLVAPADFADWNGLDLFINNATAEAWLDDTVEIARETLAQISQDLAEAHDAAANVFVANPSEDAVNNFKDKLNAVHADIQRDQRFRAAAKLAKSLADTIEKHSSG